MTASVLTVAIFVAIMLVVNPEDTSAGVFSFVNSLIGGGEVKADSTVEQKTTNSQTMTLLEPAVNINPNPTTQSHDLSIVDNSALETPSGPAGTVKEVEAKAMSNDKVSIYTVRDGDTLASIAKMFDVTPNTVLWANDLKNAKDLKAGQELIILPISGVKYIVKKGDTVKSIAIKYHGDSQEIVDFNNLADASSLVVGDEIIIPDGDATVDSQTKTGTKGGTKVAAAKNAISGYFMKPTKGIKTQGLHGKYKTAVDLAGPVGTPVYAAASGKVIVAKMGGYNGGYGNYIVIEHSNGMQTIYAHLSSVDIQRGDKVDQGTFIGKMGSTGNSTGSHLHFEILGARNWNPFN